MTPPSNIVPRANFLPDPYWLTYKLPCGHGPSCHGSYTDMTSQKSGFRFVMSSFSLIILNIYIKTCAEQPLLEWSERGRKLWFIEGHQKDTALTLFPSQSPAPTSLLPSRVVWSLISALTCPPPFSIQMCWQLTSHTCTGDNKPLIWNVSDISVLFFSFTNSIYVAPLSINLRSSLHSGDIGR